ncbi:hypothetical protein IM40_04220 [Candidatus Paracaedimonas acanthamoebae]|nr:hypothetical protein IM40_04220 [Candidatus Paracaedimonas acanthamoebae]
MIAFQPIFFTSGLFLISLALGMVGPGLVDFFHHDINWQAFALASGVTLFIGLLLVLANRSQKIQNLTVRDTFLLTAINWLTTSIFAALPFIFTYSTPSLTDSFFEAISGLTTTGATAIVRLDYASHGIILWRSLLQWFGGIGIVLMALTILPLLRIGGMQLFRSEFSDRSEKILPKVSQIASAIFGTYIFLTFACTLALWWAGMTFFHAFCHALSTVSTGGFSTFEASIEYFNDPYIEIVLIIFMIMGAITLTLFVRCIQGEAKTLFKDNQVRTLFKILIIASLATTFWLWQDGHELMYALRHSIFNVTSILTTTGFNSQDYSLWGNFPIMIMLALSVIGGCTGSTSGGIKIFRFHVMYATVKTQILQLRRPHGVFIPMYNGKPIPEGIFLSVFTFFALFVACLGALALALSLFELDLLTCLFAALSVLNNMGTGFGDILGDTGTYAALPTGAKWLLMFGMLVGRLEYITILILFSPKFWRD